MFQQDSYIIFVYLPESAKIVVYTKLIIVYDYNILFPIIFMIKYKVKYFEQLLRRFLDYAQNDR